MKKNASGGEGECQVVVKQCVCVSVSVCVYVWGGGVCNKSSHGSQPSPMNHQPTNQANNRAISYIKSRYYTIESTFVGTPRLLAAESTRLSACTHTVLCVCMCLQRAAATRPRNGTARPGRLGSAGKEGRKEAGGEESETTDDSRPTASMLLLAYYYVYLLCTVCILYSTSGSLSTAAVEAEQQPVENWQAGRARVHTNSDGCISGKAVRKVV